MKELIKRLLDARRDGLNIAGEIYTENGTINIRHCFSLINTTLSDESIEIKDGDFEFYLDQKCVKDCQYYSSQDCYNISGCFYYRADWGRTQLLFTKEGGR